MKKYKWWIFGTVIFAAIIGWAIVASTQPLPGKELPNQGRDHVSEDKWSTFKYNSNPPTSGPHDPVWTTKGIYTNSSVDIGKGHLLHSLEHGYIEIHYNCQAPKTGNTMDDSMWSSPECKNLVKQLTDIYQEKGDHKFIIVPDPTINPVIAVVAWQRIDTMNPLPSSGLSGVQKKEIEDFVDAFREHGPEQTMEP